VSAAADALDGTARVFCLIAPNSLGVVLSRQSFDRVCSETSDEGIGISESYAYMSDKVYTVDAYSTLRAHNDEYVYLRTDHHWTALGAYYAYREFARTAGIEPADLEGDFTSFDMTGHLGLFYSLCGSPYQMRANSDTVTAYVPKSDIETKVTNLKGQTYTGRLVYDYTSSVYSYKYAAFIGGDNPLTVITNNDIEDDSACILIKDSYGNPFAVYLTQNYRTVYVMDYRYYMNISSSSVLSTFVEDHGVDDVIFLLSMTLSQADERLPTSANSANRNNKRDERDWYFVSYLVFWRFQHLGLHSGSGNRYSETIRWTGLLAARLGPEFRVIEEGLNGRTTAFCDYIQPWTNGADYLPPCALSNTAS
jgi:hypothetical protein